MSMSHSQYYPEKQFFQDNNKLFNAYADKTDHNVEQNDVTIGGLDWENISNAVNEAKTSHSKSNVHNSSWDNIGPVY